MPYFEQQRGLMCAVHALNHSVGHPAFCAEDMDAAVEHIVCEALAFATAVNQTSEETTERHVSAGGNYSEQAMAEALNLHGRWQFDQTPLKQQEEGLEALWQEGVVGAVVHLPGHWAALRREDDVIWWMDSLQPHSCRLGAQAS